jgi:hypothetical protein
MSYTSNYNLNIRLSNIESRLNALVPVPPGYTYDLTSVLGVGNSAGTFDIDMNNNDILDCNNLDVVTINGAVYPPVETQGLQEVLDINNTAIDQAVIIESLGTGTQLVRSTLQADPTNNSNLELRLVEPAVSVSLVEANANGSNSLMTTTFIDSVTGDTAQNTIRSQLNQSQSISTAIGGGITSTTTINTSTGAVQNTGAITDGISTGTNALSATLSSVQTGSSWTNGTTTASIVTSADGVSARDTCSYTGGGFITSTEMNAQAGAVEYLGSVADTGTNLTTKRFLLSNGSVFNRDRATDGAGTTATSDELTDYTLNVSSTKTFDNGTILNTLTQTINPVVVSQSNLFKTTAVDESSSSMNASNGNANFGCEYQTILPPDIANIANMEVNTTEATSSVQAYSISGGYGHILKMNANTGSALIEHTTTLGSNKNLLISTQGSMLLSSTNLDATAGNLSFTTATAGGASLPNLTLTNTGNSTSGVALEVFKDRPTTANGDVLFQESIYGRDSAGNKQEYTRITHTIRDRTSGVEDGSLELGAFVNGSYANFLQLNANDAPIGEVNIFRPLDFIGGSDANSTIKTSGTGSVNLNLDATSSAGTGAIALKTKNGTPGSGGGLLLTGDTLLSPTSGGNSGQHLCLTIGGVVYKIRLELP